MKKTILVIFASLLCFPSYSQVESNNRISYEQIQNVDYSSFVGEYYFFIFDVKISLNKDNKLILTLPIISEDVEKFSDLIQSLDKDTKEKFPNKIFPSHGDYELIQIKPLNFMIKDSGGYSIELKKEHHGFDSQLKLYNSNLDIVTVESFYKLIFLYRDILYKFRNLQYEKLKEEATGIRLNMYNLQTALSTYAVDHGDVIYPDNLNSLVQEAKSREYWSEIINPFTEKSGISQEGSMLDLKDYKKLTSPSPGLVIFEPVDCSYNKDLKENSCNDYKIYGTDETGKLIKDGEDIFYLHDDTL